MRGRKLSQDERANITSLVKRIGILLALIAFVKWRIGKREIIFTSRITTKGTHNQQEPSGSAFVRSEEQLQKDKEYEARLQEELKTIKLKRQELQEKWDRTKKQSLQAMEKQSQAMEKFAAEKQAESDAILKLSSEASDLLMALFRAIPIGTPVSDSRFTFLERITEEVEQAKTSQELESLVSELKTMEKEYKERADADQAMQKEFKERAAEIQAMQIELKEFIQLQTEAQDLLRKLLRRVLTSIPADCPSIPADCPEFFRRIIEEIRLAKTSQELRPLLLQLREMERSLN